MSIRIRPARERPQRAPQAWQRTLLFTFIGQTFSILGFSIVSPFMPLYVQQLGIHGTTSITLWVAMMSAGVAIGMAIASPIWGVLADRYGRKMMVVRAAASASVLVGLMGLATNAYQLVGLRFLQGIFTGTVSASQALVSSQTPRQRLGFALGVMQTAIFIGDSLGPLAGGIVAQISGFRPSFVVAACMLAVAALVVGVCVREDKSKIHAADRPKTGLIAGMTAVLIIPGLLPVIGAIFAVRFAVTQVIPILAQFVQLLQGPQDHVAVVTGIIFACAGIAGAISSTTVGWFSDRIGHKKVLASAAVCAALISIPQSFVTEAWQLALLRVLDGFALGAMLPTAGAILAGLVPSSKRGAAYGLLGAAVSLGFAAGPLTSAAIVAVSGIRAVFLSAAVLLGAIAVWVVLMVPAERSEAALAAADAAEAAEP